MLISNQHVQNQTRHVSFQIWIFLSFPSVPRPVPSPLLGLNVRVLSLPPPIWPIPALCLGQFSRAPCSSPGVRPPHTVLVSQGVLLSTLPSGWAPPGHPLHCCSVSLELRCSHSSPRRITDSQLGCPPESRRHFEILNCEWDLVSGSRIRARVFWESPSSDSDDWVTAATGPQCLVNKPQLFYLDTLGTNFLLWALPPLFFAYPKVCPNWWWQSLFPECLPMLHLSLVCPWYPFFFISVSLNYNFYSRASLNETDLDKNTFKVLRIVLEC